MPDSDEPAPRWAAIDTLPRAAAAHPVRATDPTHLDHRHPENRPGSSGWTLTVTHQQAEAIRATLRPVAGTYVAPGLAQVVFQVERTAVRDHDGNITGYLG